MSNAPWIQIAYRRPLTAGKNDVSAVTVGFNVAPHQVPKAVRGYLDSQRGRVVIELRYADDEEFRLERQDERVWLRLGKHSRRLFGLELETTGSAVPKVQLRFRAVEEIEEAVEKLIMQKPSSRERENYSFAKQAIESRKSRLSSELLVPA